MTMVMAPGWQTSAWLNTDTPPALDQLRGKVVLLHAFQTLCPGCVNEGIAQAKRVATRFAGTPLVVVGLHTVFEHHDVMGPAALRVFLHEYSVRFPVRIDAPGTDKDPLPLTMRAYAMQGTPTTVLIDAQGRRRRQVLGKYDDLVLGSDIGARLPQADHGDAATRAADNDPEARAGNRCIAGPQ